MVKDSLSGDADSPGHGTRLRGRACAAGPPPKNIRYLKKQLRKKIFVFAPALAALLVAARLCIPGMEIFPAAGLSGVALTDPVELHSSAMSKISKFAVYADNELLALEYNLGSSDLVRDFDLKAGQRIRVEAKATSLLGINREFAAEYSTVPALALAAMYVDGSRFSAGQPVAPGADISFQFNKPLSQASLSLDGGEPVELMLDPEDPSICRLPAGITLAQGVSHLLKVTAEAVDSAALPSREIRVDGVMPLSLSGRVDDSGGVFRVELYASTGFADPAAVQAALATTLPGATVTVERQKIIIACSPPDAAHEYSITLAGARGDDGSSLEAPLALTVAFRGSSDPTVSYGGTAVQAYVYSSSSSPAASAREAGPAQSGPPPGWPDCHPWPPQ